MIEFHHLMNPHPLEHSDKRKPTLAEKRKLAQATETIMRLHMHIYGREIGGLHIPEEWELLPDRYPATPKKVRITLLMDEPVAKYFRSFGRGYGALVNDVLKSYAQLRAAKMLEAAEDRSPRGEAL